MVQFTDHDLAMSTFTFFGGNVLFLHRLNNPQYEKHMLHCYDIMFTQMFVYMHIFIHHLLPKSSYINAHNVCSVAQDNY